jgi:hypothetical protein
LLLLWLLSVGLCCPKRGFLRHRVTCVNQASDLRVPVTQRGGSCVTDDTGARHGVTLVTRDDAGFAVCVTTVAAGERPSVGPVVTQ